MAVRWPGGPSGDRTDRPAYTPDFAPIALDVLGFRPLPRFAFGRSSIFRADPRQMLVASQFQILNGVMVPAHPNLDDSCSPAMLQHTTLNPSVGMLSPCGREKIVESIQEELLSGTLRSPAN
jgi:hypothetical protein